jgi:ParB-like chromosome segregation protein Spo0J
MKITKMELEKLKPYEKNPRINAEAVPQVAKSIQEFGFQQPIVVDKDYTIIVGHTRYLAAKSLELKFVPVVVASDLSPEKVKAYRLMDNRTHERSKWDNNLLIFEINDLKEFYSPDFLDFSEMMNLSEESEEKPELIDREKEYLLVCICENESHQQELFDKFQHEGIQCKIM